MIGGPVDLGRAGGGLAALASAGLLERGRLDPADAADLESVARDMEGLFMTVLVKELRKTIPGKGLFGEGPGSEVYEGFFDQALGQALAEGPGSTLRQAMYEALASSRRGWQIPESAAASGKDPVGDSKSPSATTLRSGHQEPASASEHSEVSDVPTVAPAGRAQRSSR